MYSRNMRFRLSTLIIVTSALGILFAQYPYVFQNAAERHTGGVYLLTPRFGGVLFVEIFLLIAWIIARRGDFPWRGLLITAGVIDGLIAVLVLLFDDSPLADRLAHSMLMALVCACMVLVGLSTLFGARSAIAALGRGFARLERQGKSPPV